MDLKQVAYRGVLPGQVKAEPGVSHNGHPNGHVRDWTAGSPSPTTAQPQPNNGYSSPLSSSSYGPYSPNGKIDSESKDCKKMPPKNKRDLEQRRLAQRLCQKQRYYKIKTDPELLEREKQKRRERYLKKKEQNKKKSAREMEKQRQKWKENSKRYRQKKKEESGNEEEKVKIRRTQKLDQIQRYLQKKKEESEKEEEIVIKEENINEPITTLAQRLRRKRRYNKIKKDPNLLEIEKQKRRETYLKRKERIKKRSAREIEEQRRKWKENSKRYREKKKEESWKNEELEIKEEIIEDEKTFDPLLETANMQAVEDNVDDGYHFNVEVSCAKKAEPLFTKSQLKAEIRKVRLDELKKKKRLLRIIENYKKRDKSQHKQIERLKKKIVEMRVDSKRNESNVEEDEFYLLQIA